MTSQLDDMVYERDALVSNKIPKRHPDKTIITSSADERINPTDDIFHQARSLI
jgi:hypothetical protein